MAYLWGQLISKDGNTVECCENNNVKDQNGNDLRLCSAIDKERVQADEEKNEANQTKVFVCNITNKHQTSHGARIDTNFFWSCYNGLGQKINDSLGLTESMNGQQPHVYNKDDYLFVCTNIAEVHTASLKMDSSGVGENYKDKYSTLDSSYSAEDICKFANPGTLGYF